LCLTLAASASHRSGRGFLKFQGPGAPPEAKWLKAALRLSLHLVEQNGEERLLIYGQQARQSRWREAPFAKPLVLGLGSAEAEVYMYTASPVASKSP